MLVYSKAIFHNKRNNKEEMIFMKTVHNKGKSNKIKKPLETAWPPTTQMHDLPGAEEQEGTLADLRGCLALLVTVLNFACYESPSSQTFNVKNVTMRMKTLFLNFES